MCLAMTNFSLCKLDFLKSYTSNTFYLVLPSWQISFYAGWVFPTYVLGVHFIFCLRRGEFLFYAGWFFSTNVSCAYFILCLYCDRFPFIHVGFFWLMCLEHILSYVSIVIDFSLLRSSFLDLHTSITFYLVSLPWQIFLYISLVFLTHMLRAYFILYLCHYGFLFMQVGFS